MKKRRVAVTGIGVISPLGVGMSQLMEGLYVGGSSIRSIPEWAKAPYGFQTTLCSPVADFDFDKLPRKSRRTMSRVAGLATFATEQALQHSGLSASEIESERMGISYGSTMGGTSAIREFYDSVLQESSMVANIRSTTFPQIMSHTCAANIATHFRIPGRVIASCTACAASTQSIGFAFEAIRGGIIDRAVCGGAEELEPSVVAVFDVMGATARSANEEPNTAPRPFSKNRDGIVVGEGAGTLILEEWDAAQKRGAKIFAEIIGFYTNNDATHMTNPSVDGLVSVMKNAVNDAEIIPSMVSYVNAHGTGTAIGDAVEAKAIYSVFGSQVPVSSMKGHFGHLMGAAGVVETITAIGMMQDETLVGTKNINPVDSDLPLLNLLAEGAHKGQRVDYVLKNSFAFGGINASLVLKKV